MKYQKKPVVIEAWQLPEDDDQTLIEAPPAWLLEALVTNRVRAVAAGVVEIDTSEGVMRASPLDWIIKGVENELYPCKPSIFEATYVADVGELFPSLQPHEQRVVTERAELGERLEKLNAFMATAAFTGLADKERGLLTYQASAMTEYLYALNARIAGFHSPPQESAA